MNSDLRRLIDENAVKALHLRYCRGVDRMDWDLVRACYHPDAIDDHGAYKGGVDGFIAWVAETLRKYESTTHFTGNQLVEIEGDTAFAEHYARVYHRRSAGNDGPAVDVVANVRYIDKVARRDGQWRIARRVIVLDSDRLDPVDATWAGVALRRGARDGSDASYER